MTQTSTISPRGRDRALGMLRRLTVSAGVVAVLATGGLGALAAAIYPGTTATSTASSSGGVQASSQAPSSASSGSSQATSGGS